MIKVFGRKVLVEKTATLKKQAVILSESAKKEDRFDFDYTVLEAGDECQYVKKGDKIILNKNAMTLHSEVVEHSKEKVVAHTIFNEIDIVGKRN